MNLHLHEHKFKFKSFKNLIKIKKTE